MNCVIIVLQYVKNISKWILEFDQSINSENSEISQVN